MVFLNPFKKYDLEDFSGVWVPLAEAPPRHASVVAENKRRASLVASITTDSEKGLTKKDTNRSTGSDDDATLTLESLRAEVDEDLVASGHDSVYDRKSKVINKAIQDIGMGSYQWKLFILCGFGWLVSDALHLI